MLTYSSYRLRATLLIAITAASTPGFAQNESEISSGDIGARGTLAGKTEQSDPAQAKNTDDTNSLTADSGDVAPSLTAGSQSSDGAATSSMSAGTQSGSSAPELTPEERKTRMAQLREYISKFQGEAEEYESTLKMRVDQQYRREKRRLQKNYDLVVSPVIEAERLERLKAIDGYEAFVARYPNNAGATPDAMFRLAELHFEKSEDSYQEAKRNYDQAFDAWVANDGKGEEPYEPERELKRTIEVYQTLVQRFPDYKYGDAVHYLLGYSLLSTDKEEQALKTWRRLAKKYPESPFKQEVSFRMGDFYFEQEEWARAKKEFSSIVANKDSKFYDKALYKLAWTNYLTSDFDTAVDQFFDLLIYSERLKKEAEERGELSDNSGSVLEDEALQYIAISMSDDNWVRPRRYMKATSDDEFADYDIDYVGHAKSLFKDNEERKPIEREIAYRLGDILFAQSKNQQAIEGFRWAQSVDPLHRDGPKIQDLIVQAYERERDFEAASIERDKLITEYGVKSAWGQQYINDGDARREADELAKIGLYKAAVFYHQQGNKFSENGESEQAGQLFSAAADNYQRYLDLYPRDKDAYDLRFYLAETYYYSENYERAAREYAKVRDSSLGKTYRGDAAVNLVYSVEKIDELRLASGKISPIPGATESEDTQAHGEATTSPKLIKEMPLLREAYVAAIDRYAQFTPDHEQVPAFRYKAAALVNAYGDQAGATQRFKSIIADYPQHEAAKFAAYQIMDQLLAAQEWEKLRDFAATMQGTMSDDSGKFAELFSGAEFKLAQQMLEQGGKLLDEGKITDGLTMLEKGANEYVRLLDENPNREFADAMAYNAALSYEKARRPLKAAALYERLYQTYPDSEYAPEGLFRVATKSEQAFEFERAIDAYQLLVKKYPDHERRVDAQINAALALEGLQQYDAAAREFERFATLFPDRDDAPAVFYRAAIVQKKREKPMEEIKTLNRFIAKYRSNGSQAPRIVEAYSRIGDIHTERAKKFKGASSRRAAERDAKQAWENALSYFKKAPNNPNARYYAAKSDFLLVNRDFVTYQNMAIKARSDKKQVEELIAKSQELKVVENKLKGIINKYKQAEWSLAALYRIGGLYDDLQQKLFGAPCPDNIKKIAEFACDEYAGALEDKGYVIEDKAVEAYRVAYEKANEFKLKNEWTKKTVEALNLLRSGEYSIEKEALTNLDLGERYNVGVIMRDGGSQELELVNAAAREEIVNDAEGESESSEQVTEVENDDLDSNTEAEGTSARTDTSDTEKLDAALNEADSEGGE